MSNPWMPRTNIVVGGGGGGYSEESVRELLHKYRDRIADLELNLKKALASKDSYIQTLNALVGDGKLKKEDVMEILEPARVHNCKEYGISSIK